MEAAVCESQTAKNVDMFVLYMCKIMFGQSQMTNISP